MGGPEANLVRRVLAELNSWPQTYAVKNHGSPYTRRGEPDISGCRLGQAFLLELKAPGKKPTVLQARALERWAQAGATVGWADNFDEAIEIVRTVRVNT